MSPFKDNTYSFFGSSIVSTEVELAGSNPIRTSIDSIVLASVFSTSSPPFSPQLMSRGPYTPSPTPTAPLPSSVSSPPLKIHPMITRPKNGIHKSKVLFSYLSTTEPSTIQEALAHKQWQKMVYDEYNALVQNKTWTLVPLTPTRSCCGL